MVGYRSWSSVKSELEAGVTRDPGTIMVAKRLVEMTDRHERIRHISGQEPVTLSELLALLTQELGGEEGMNRFGDSLVLSSGFHFRWTSPETDDELEERVRLERHHEERLAKWERETYVRLHEKFGPLKDE